MPKRVDSNQPAIVKALRAVGATVVHVHEVGHGFGDILVGRNGINYLMEIKDGDKPPSKRKLTPDEQIFHQWWRGQVEIVNSPAEALLVIGAI